MNSNLCYLGGLLLASVIKFLLYVYPSHGLHTAVAQVLTGSLLVAAHIKVCRDPLTTGVERLVSGTDLNAENAWCVGFCLLIQMLQLHDCMCSMTVWLFVCRHSADDVMVSKSSLVVIMVNGPQCNKHNSQ